MRRFSTSTEIAAPAERVWAVMHDVDRWPEWTPSITSVRRLGDRPLAVGNRVIIRQPKFPPALWTVTVVEPGHMFTWCSVAPGLRIIGDHRVAPAGGGSVATLSLEIEGLFGGAWGSLTKGITERYIALEAEGLKARSEDPEYRHRGGKPRSGAAPR